MNPKTGIGFQKTVPILTLKFLFMSLFYKTTRTLLSRFRPFLLALFWGLATLPTLAQTTWTGNTNADWNTAGNWSAGVPTTTLDAVIPNVTPSPTIGASTSAVAKSVEVQSGATLTIASSATLSINDNKTTTNGIVSFVNEGDVQNSGQLFIGNLNNAGSYGILNNGTFSNKAGGTIQIDRVVNALYNNTGTFTNAATITIGSLASVNGSGLYNIATFNNNTGGRIQIDQTGIYGLYNDTGGTFTNAATIVLGSIASTSNAGLSNSATFYNNAGGTIQIDRASNSGLFNNTGSTFTNSATITIGGNASGSVGTYGIINVATFNNNTGGSIQIDRSNSNGIYNQSSGTFTNAATLTIGSIAAVGNTGIWTSGAFNNNAGGSIQIDRSSSEGINNSGTFTNASTLTIGSIAAVGSTGIWTSGTFNNNAGGSIQIDRSNSNGIYNGGTFTNAATLTIGGIAAVGNTGIWTSGAFNNNAGGSIQIDRSSSEGIHNSGTFTNAATLTIGSIAAVGNTGIWTSGAFNNNAGGSIQIDRSSSEGINNSGTFTNASTLTIGSIAAVGSTGIWTSGTFNNNAGGSIQIDRSNSNGIYNGGTFTNAATLTIGGIAAVGNTGIWTSGAFNNNAGGSIQIDRSSSEGINNGGPFTNAAALTIGSIAEIGQYGIFTVNTFRNEAGGNIQIDRITNSGLTNNGTVINEALLTIGTTMATYGIFNNNTINNNCGGMITTGQIIMNTSTFTNNGTIIEKASGNSSISSNSSLVRNLNGGTFTITTNTGVLTTTEGTAATTITASPSLTVDQGQSVTLTAEGATSYRWSTEETTPAISVTAAGPYSVTGTIGSCSQVVSVTLTVNVVTDVTVTNPAAVCAPATVDLTQGVATSSIPNATFSFYTDADGTQLVPNPAAVGEGTYYVKATSQEGGPSALKPITVVVKTPPTVSINPNNPSICSGQSTTLTASGADTYLWSTDATSATISVSATGPYSVTGITNGCSATATQTVTENAIPAPNLTTNVVPSSPGSATLIQNTPFVTLTASGCSGTLAWTGPNNPSGSTITVPTSATGTLSYTVFCQQGACSSPPASFTITVTTGTTTGSFDGFVNGADCGTFRGWAWDRNKPNTVINIEIMDGSTVIGTLPAGDFRQDLLDAGKGNGKHAFRFTIPESVKDGLPHNLSARVAGSSFILKDSPKALICVGTAPVGNKPPQPPTPTVLNAPLTAQVGVPFSGTLVAFTDPEGTTMSYGLSDLPAGLSLNPVSRVISGTPTQAGTFVLTYTATDEGGANNSVSFNLTINPAETTTVTGNFEGYLDKVECGTIRGWVWDRNKPNTPVTVEFYTGNTVWGSVVANIYRVDLKNAGKGNGAHAYSFDVPAVLKDGTSRLIYGRVQGSTFVLKDSGKPLTCNVPVRLSAETAPDLQVAVLGNPVLGTALSVEIRGAEGQPLRMRLTDLSGRLVGEHQIEQAQAVERQTLSLQNQPAGLLLLRVTSGLRSVTVKVLK
ncbi:S-layer family protein [Larkinella sp. C7]|uniref:beta strand repeat-containing protein n=1 Tax=Larkinella sp. C7 TaxID=2576607 RepID=UPI0011110CD4|nr:putative Ig domain-containing protein [Larkinella sp. C7]